MVLSAPTILQSLVQIPCIPSMFFNLYYWNCNEKRTKINKKRPGLVHFLKKLRTTKTIKLKLKKLVRRSVNVLQPGGSSHELSIETDGCRFESGFFSKWRALNKTKKDWNVKKSDNSLSNLFRGKKAFLPFLWEFYLERCTQEYQPRSLFGVTLKKATTGLVLVRLRLQSIVQPPRPLNFWIRF